MEQLAIQQQIELLQQQQQQIAATHQQYVNMGLLQPQQVGQVQGFQPNMQGGGSVGGVSPQMNAFQFPQLTQQQLGVPMNAPNQSSHRRNQSAMPGVGMGPPPAPSSGASGYSDYNQQQNNQRNENGNHSRGRGAPPGGGHQRRHSLALPEAKKAAELAQQKRTTTGFQFPAPAPGGNGSENVPVSNDKSTSNAPTAPQGLGLQRAGNIRAGGHGRSQSMAVGGNRGSMGGRGAGGFQFPAGNDSSGGQSDHQRRTSQSGHGRSGSRNFEGNWRQPNNQNQGNDQKGFGHPSSNFQPGHRARGSMNQSMGSIGSFQYPGQPQLVQLPQGQVMMAQPQMFGGQQLNPMQLAQLQGLQQNGQMNGQAVGLQASQHAPSQLSAQQQQQQQRKTLFTPYLPQANLPALLTNGQLVAGILRVNKKNRSDAYVTTPDLDADIFICGSKDRNRALEGDFVAVELLDVDEVWSQKREKEEKKKRKDITDARNGNGANDKLSRSDSATNGDKQEVGPDGSIRRRGSLRQRPTQKKNDDVEVEGQSLLLVEEDEISDDQKPLYAGHVVAVVERIAGQMFSGTLGLLRPSSQATKEKQEAERQARDGAHGRSHDRQEKPKIVWFKPTDKRVPLIAIPTEQAPRDFVEKHHEYANRIFVACIKRWPITSLHPFGTLVEQLGEMGDLKVETDALLRDNNFGADEFSDAVMKSIGFENWSVASEGESLLASRRDFREETSFTIDPSGTKELDDAFHIKNAPDGKVEIGIHVTDIAYFVKGNSLVDREAKKRGTAVYLVDRLVNLLPPRVSTDLCSLLPGQERLTVSVVFKANPDTGVIDDDVWIGRGVIKSAGSLSYDDVDSILKGDVNGTVAGVDADIVRSLNVSNTIHTANKC